ncbi:MAG: methyltransferase domain-containing protein [Nitrosopumilus sp.]|nr:MAG: methyltransferase domain-containing protein [Nitrosopumilus sp.]
MDDSSWNDMSLMYDDNVENNSDPVISGYISEEIQIVSNFCKKVIKPGVKYTVIDMGSGTGRVLFSLQSILGDSVSYCGLDVSESMIQLSKNKQVEMNAKNISFLKYDATNPEIDDLFDGDDSVKIVLCMYNTVGVIDATLRRQFFDNMIGLAGKDGIALVSAFNGDNFVFAAPGMYVPMKKMVGQIDEDSFDEKKLAFKNRLGYYSQWFTQNQMLQLLRSNAQPIPINVILDGNVHTFGNIFSDRDV